MFSPNPSGTLQDRLPSESLRHAWVIPAPLPYVLQKWLLAQCGSSETPSAEPCRPNRRSELCPRATTGFVLLYTGLPTTSVEAAQFKLQQKQTPSQAVSRVLCVERMWFIVALAVAALQVRRLEVRTWQFIECRFHSKVASLTKSVEGSDWASASTSALRTSPLGELTWGCVFMSLLRKPSSSSPLEARLDLLPSASSAWSFAPRWLGPAWHAVLGHPSPQGQHDGGNGSEDSSKITSAGGDNDEHRRTKKLCFR